MTLISHGPALGDLGSPLDALSDHAIKGSTDLTDKEFSMSLVPVSREAHGQMRLRPFSSFSFVQSAPVIRIVAGELAQIAANFPIAFLDENGSPAPYAVMGLSQTENQFVSEDGQWLAQYVPAMIRRFPFMPGRTPNGQGDVAALMVDDAWLSTDEGEPLFGPDEGEPSGPVARAIQLVGMIEVEAAQLGVLSKALAAHGLIEPLTVEMKLSEDGLPTKLEGLSGVSEAKLLELPDAAFLELRKSGALNLAYAQLLSVAQFARVQALATARLNKIKSSLI